MTALVAPRKPLEILSMNSTSGRRTSKRLAAAADYEQDDDFQFVRKSKRTKTTEADEGVKKSTQEQTLGRAGRGPAAVQDASASVLHAATGDGTAAAATKAKAARRKPAFALDSSPDAFPMKIVKRSTRKSTKTTGDNTDDEDAAGKEQNDGTDRSRLGATSRTLPGGTRMGPSGRKEQQQQQERMGAHQSETSVESAKIALPMSDTPIINRNKEMRRKGHGARRSSLGSRGRRASSLIESGQTAIPHREVRSDEFFKHIEADGLVEPRRMKQLLTWCAERSLIEKPPLGTPNSNAILGARAIQDQLLKDFSSRSEFSDWFSRDEDASRRPATGMLPNPRNTELDQRIAKLLENTKRLTEERNAWQAIERLPPEEPSLFEGKDSLDLVDIELPDFNLLDADEHPIRKYLTDPALSFRSITQDAEARLRKVQSRLEFQVDQLWDTVHKLEQRVFVAGREADSVLRTSAARLKEREERERVGTGTRDMPILEVLRSLGNILPEGNGG